MCEICVLHLKGNTHGHLKVPKCEIFDLFDFNDFYVMKCSARDWERSGLLGGIPRVLGQISALTLKGPL